MLKVADQKALRKALPPPVFALHKHPAREIPSGCSPRLSTAPDTLLLDRERAELARQGAKAAARGELPTTNPMSLPENRPPSTGESTTTWSQRCEAWRAGHHLQCEARDRAFSTGAEPEGGQGEDEQY